MDDLERLGAALDHLDSKLCEDIVLAVEALANAREMIPVGSGRSDVHTKGYESSVPGELHLLAAEVLREGQRALRSIYQRQSRLNRHTAREAHGQHGRPCVLTPGMVHRAAELRATRHSITATVRLLAVEFDVSESALWKSRERGERSKVGTVEHAFAFALKCR
jgi:hypothetical protein